MRNDDDSDEQNIEVLEILSVKHFKQVLPVTVHHFYIIEEIKEVGFYLDLINTLKMAEAHDTVFIYLNTPGGLLATTIQIMAAMKQCQGTVITCLEGEVCSAGTMIFLSGHQHIINANCTFMIHSYSDNFSGKGHEITAHAKYTEDFWKSLARDVYGNFLTKEEMNDVTTSGKDIWLNSDEVAKRLKEKVISDSAGLVHLNKFPLFVQPEKKDDSIPKNKKLKRKTT